MQIHGIGSFCIFTILLFLLDLVIFCCCYAFLYMCTMALKSHNFFSIFKNSTQFSKYFTQFCKIFNQFIFKYLLSFFVDEKRLTYITFFNITLVTNHKGQNPITETKRTNECFVKSDFSVLFSRILFNQIWFYFGLTLGG